jgi:hypothetical protein
MFVKHLCTVMEKFKFHNFPRDIEAGNLIEIFLVSAVSSLLMIRLFLAFTGYPQIGRGNFHIAHMLFGGAIMMITLIMLLVYLNREVKYTAAVMGGIGFGAFIDELGKFITNDNNYFYEPTVAIIYVIFILLFLISRAAERLFNFSKEEYGINAIEIAKNVVMHKFESDDKNLALNLIKQSDQNNIIIKMLGEALRQTRAAPNDKPTLFHQINHRLKDLYIKIITHPFFTTITIWSFIIISLINFAGAIYNFKNAQTFPRYGELVFSFISGLIIFIGAQVLIYKISRMFAYELFKISVLLSIFLTQFFRFLEDQFSAISVLILYLIVLSVLQYLIYEESLVTKEVKV